MKQKISLFIAYGLILLFVTTSYAQVAHIKSLGQDIEATVNYSVTVYSPHFVSFTGLSPARNYTLKCTPYIDTYFPRVVNIEVFNDSSTIVGKFGGTSTTAIEFKHIEPYRHDFDNFTIDYQLTSSGLFPQKGVCVFN